MYVQRAWRACCKPASRFSPLWLPLGLCVCVCVWGVDSCRSARPHPQFSLSVSVSWCTPLFLTLNFTYVIMKTLITVVVTLLIGTAAALKCYVCNTGNDSACGDEFNADSPALQAAFIQECGNSTEFVDMEPFCRKTKEYIEYTHLDVVVEYRVHRECGYMKREGYDCYQKRAEDYVQDVCQCTSDLCNTAPSFKPLTPLLALTLPFFAKFM